MLLSRYELDAQLADAVRDARGLALRLELLADLLVHLPVLLLARGRAVEDRAAVRAALQRDRAAAGVPLAAPRTNLFGVERAQRPLEVAGRLAGQRLSVQLVDLEARPLLARREARRAAADDVEHLHRHLDRRVATDHFRAAPGPHRNGCKLQNAGQI